MSKKVLAVFGTRPEAIKMAPVVAELRRSSCLDVRVCVTAQHREMLDQVLRLFEIVPDHDLDLMVPSQTLDTLTARVLQRVGEVFDREQPDIVLVHGDTTTTLAASLASFYRKLTLGHVEAGLRSGSLMAPWPEEMNRRVTTLATSLHFAPTAGAQANLLRECVPESRIYVTGNTVVDALMATVQKTRAGGCGALSADFKFLRQGRRLVLVTGHRRENFGAPFQEVCSTLIDIADAHDVQILYPVHP
ncbi:MAG: UDP-N-acetylglucosamine 2-epimerase (non-hydrolyzing), partial [Rhizobiales bacterium]|nr:UDP-N-acetylglucosamine 2-epimerase (non-hydrolyzing) [Hyphomicrobiales bacterium]